jgi:KTSC domain
MEIRKSTMPWVRLESRVFRAARYVEEARQLYLEFLSGAIYRYHDFPPHQYAEFIAADSHGKYFNRYIVGRFPEEQIRPPRNRP